VTGFSILTLSLVGCVFAASAVTKLTGRQAYRAFREGLGETGLVPAHLRPAVTALLPAAEAALAVGLLVAAGLTAVAAPGAARLAEPVLAAAAGLTAALAVGVAVVVRRGTRARCACFGARSARPLGRVHLARNLCLLAVICAGLATNPLTPAAHPVTGPVAGLAALAGAVAAVLFVRWDELAGLFLPIAGASAPPRAARDTRAAPVPRSAPAARAGGTARAGRAGGTDRAGGTGRRVRRLAEDGGE
jgi:hypothetical protein